LRSSAYLQLKWAGIHLTTGVTDPYQRVPQDPRLRFSAVGDCSQWTAGCRLSADVVYGQRLARIPPSWGWSQVLLPNTGRKKL